jgi:hypothetical protein
MWCIGNENIPHVRQDTNVVVESFHNNIKQILYSSWENLTRRRMDWLIYNLVGDVLIHYYVKNKKQEGIVANALLQARDLPNTNVLLCLDGEDIAFVAFTNHLGKCGLYTP